MTSLTTELTWQFNVNQTLTNASGTTNFFNTILAIKNSLKGFASSPWVVVGSSNKSVSAMDGADRWSTSSDISYTSGTGVVPWIVLRQPGMNNLQMLLSGPKTSGGPSNLYISFSPGGLFTGGDVTPNSRTTNMPSATDECVLLNSTGFFQSATTSTNNNLHVMQSADGYCSRVFIYDPALANCSHIILIETAKNPTPGWTWPHFIYESGINTYSPGLVQNSVNKRFTVHNNIEYHMALTYEAYGAGTNDEACHSKSTGAINQISQKYDFYPIGLASNAVGIRGSHGRLYDLWWGPGVRVNPVAPNNGDTYFSNKTWENNAYVQFNDMVTPFSGAALL